MNILKIVEAYFTLIGSMYIVIVCIYGCILSYKLKEFTRILWIILPIVEAILLAWTIPLGIHALINILNTMHW